MGPVHPPNHTVSGAGSFAPHSVKDYDKRVPEEPSGVPEGEHDGGIHLGLALDHPNHRHHGHDAYGYCSRDGGEKSTSETG